MFGIGEQLDLIREVIIELKDPRRWRRGRRRQGRGKQNNYRRWGRRGSPLDEGPLDEGVQRRGSVATSGRPQQRGLVERG